MPFLNERLCFLSSFLPEQWACKLSWFFFYFFVYVLFYFHWFFVNFTPCTPIPITSLPSHLPSTLATFVPTEKTRFHSRSYSMSQSVPQFQQSQSPASALTYSTRIPWLLLGRASSWRSMEAGFWGQLSVSLGRWLTRQGGPTLQRKLHSCS